MTLDEEITKLDLIASDAFEGGDANEFKQLANWLRELQGYRFEISECKAILDRPTPDVTENDRKRAMYVLQTFPDVRGDEK